MRMRLSDDKHDDDDEIKIRLLMIESLINERSSIVMLNE